MKRISGDFFISQGPPKTEQIVEIAGFQRVRQRLDLNIEREKGNIILIVGTRGIGKSTCLEYSRYYVNNELGYDCSRLLDIGLSIPQLLELEYNERVTFILKKIALVISKDKKDNISDVIDILNAQEKGPFFLFIDNLDRLYQNKDDLSFVQYFFQTADPILKALSKKVVIVISCAPEWNIFLKQRDLSYTNFSNSISLEPLSDDEIGKLIESRAVAQGYEIDNIIKEELLPVLRIASRGNSRSVFQFLERVIGEVDENELPIDITTFQRVVGSELFDGSIENLREIASESPIVSWGINQMWRYFDVLQKSGFDCGTEIKKLIKTHEKNFIDESEITSTLNAWKKVSHETEFGKWVLNPQVGDMIKQWHRETKIKKEILLTAYSEKPFTTSTTNVEDYVDQYITATADKESASDAFNVSLEEYRLLSSADGNKLEEDRSKLIDSGWNCLKQLMLTIIAIEEGDVPNELSSRLDNKETIEEAGNELITCVGDIYKEFNKVNPYRSELSSIKERFRDARDNPEVVRYWDTDQMKEFVRQVLTSYEGLLRGLKPSNLATSEKRIRSEEISGMINRWENANTEFKSSIRWDYRQEKINKELKKSVLETIVAFLNTNGGKLIIGVNDEKKIIGIEKDISTLKHRDVDGFEQYIMSIIDEYIGSEQSVYITTSFLRKGYTIAIISVDKSPIPAYLESNSTQEFYIRAGNTTRKLDGRQLQNYIDNHWPSRKS
jgi:energy-coupling factor transporter ATP-binding protein EcfA2